jgi:ABC-type glycerol-3-phosphate transport system substrate-binding protein
VLPRWLSGLLATLLLAPATILAGDQAANNLVELWHTFAVNSENERIIERSVDEFEAANPEIMVKVTRIPYSQNLPQFINSSQGGEAPDIIRFSDTEIGKTGYISVEGLPLL